MYRTELVITTITLPMSVICPAWAIFSQFSPFFCRFCSCRTFCASDVVWLTNILLVGIYIFIIVEALHIKLAVWSLYQCVYFQLLRKKRRSGLNFTKLCIRPCHMFNECFKPSFSLQCLGGPFYLIKICMLKINLFHRQQIFQQIFGHSWTKRDWTTIWK